MLRLHGVAPPISNKISAHQVLQQNKKRGIMTTHKERVELRIAELSMTPTECLDKAIRLIAWLQEDGDFDGYVTADELNKWIGRAVEYIKASRTMLAIDERD